MQPGISVVIPCLNEVSSVAGVVEAALHGIQAVNVPGEVIVVDNGSTDGSPEVAERAGARVVHESHRGYGAAIRRGFADARYSVLVMADADLTYDLARLGDLVRPVLAGEADFMIGNRMNNIQEGAMPLLNRFVGNPALTLVLRMVLGRQVSDSQCGMRAIRKDAYESLGCMTTGMEFASEMIAKAVQTGLRMGERDIIYHARAGESKLRPLRDGWRHLRFMMLYVPSHAFLVPLLILWLATGIALCLLAVGPLRIRSQQFDVHSMLLLAILNVGSLQVLTGAMTARIYAHLNGFQRDPLVAWLFRHLHFRSAAVVSALWLLAGGLGILAYATRAGSRPDLFVRPDTTRVMVFCMCLIVNGLQVWLAGYLASIMALPRHADRLPPEAENTGVPDLP